ATDPTSRPDPERAGPRKSSRPRPAANGEPNSLRLATAAARIEGVRLRAASRTLAAATVALVPVLAAAPAAAEEPMNLPDQVTDTAGVLDDGQVAEIQQAFDEVTESSGEVPFIAFVPDFSGLPNTEWAPRTAEDSGLGTQNPLVAVAIDEGSWGVAVSNSAPYSTEDLQGALESSMVPALSDGDWVGAAEAYADEVEDLASGGGGGGLLTFVMVAVLVVAVIGIIALVV